MDSETSLPKKKLDRTWLYVGIGFVVCWGVFLAFFGGELITAEYVENGVKPVLTADYNWPMTDLRDRPVSLADYKGKTIFLNIWATYCGPCLQEMPSIAKLAADPRLKDVVFLCVATDESPELVKEFVAAHGKDWPMTMVRTDAGPAVFHTEGIPATFLIGPDGTIAASTVGAEDWNRPDVVEMLVKLKEPKPAAPKEEAKAE